MTSLQTFIADNLQTRPQDMVDRALATVRRHLGIEIAYLSEFVDGRSVFRAVDAPGLEHLIRTGDSHSLQDVYCQHILEGRLPRLIPDTSQEPLAAALPITAMAPIGAHVSVPIHRVDGSVYGMFCCLSTRPNATLNARDLEIMESFAGLAAEHVQGAMADRLLREQRVALIEAVLRERSFEMHLQPIYELGADRPAGFEALCRFRGEPYRSPDKWFADAEAVGLGVALELATIAAALEALPALPQDVYLSVNAAPATVATGRLAEVFAGQPLERIVLEITEHASSADWAALLDETRMWQFRGVKLAIDDAGAGVSGLQQIIRLNPDVIKLDMSLTTGVDADAAKRSLTAAMVHFASETGSLIVAEGIETHEELAVLRLLGVHRGQGWLLGRPMKLEAALTLLQMAAPAKVA